MTEGAASTGATADRVAAVVEGVLDPFVILEAIRGPQGAIVDFRFTEANGAACGDHGVPHEQLIGARLSDVLPAVAPPERFAEYVRVVETGEPLIVDDLASAQERRGPDLRHHDVRAKKVGDGLSLSWRDVSERWGERQELAAARQALAESEHHYRTIAELSTDFVVELDASMRVIWASPSITPVTGWLPEEIVGFTPMDIAPPAEAAATEAYARAGLSGTVVTGRRPFRTKVGGSRWMDRSIRPVVAADGTVTGAVAGFRDIQAEVEAEEALVASAARFQATVQGLVDPLIILRPRADASGAIVDFIYQYANPAACAYNQRSANETVGRGLYELFPTLVGDGTALAWEQVIRTGEPWAYDGHAFTNRWGDHEETRFTDLRAFAVGGELVLSWRDVTAEHQAETALRESEARYRLLADSAVDVVTLGKPDTTLTWVSPSVTTVLGWEPTALLGTRVVDMIHPDDRDAWRARGVTNPGTSAVTYEARFRQADGGYRWMSVATTAIVDKNGTAIARTGIARDISAEHAAREALEASRAELAEAQRVAHVGSWSRELGVAAVHWTDELFRILGLEPAPEPPPVSVQRRLFTTESWALLSSAMECLRTRGTPFAVDADAVRPDGELRHLVVRCEPVRDAAGAVVRTRGTIADVTELRAAELRIQDLNEGLEQRVKERTAELETFTYTLSHDLRAPLRWINGFAAMLQRRDGDRLDETSRHYLDEIRNASDRMGRLFEELLAYSRMGSQTVRTEPVDWSPIVASLQGTFGPRIATTGATLEIADPLAPVRADPMLLDRAIANLVDNGITYARPGDPARVHLSATRSGTRVRVAITDHGMGIAPEHHERIFAPFVRLHDDALPGTGIGLALVARAVRLMGSAVHVDSELGAGSTFWFDLPTG